MQIWYDFLETFGLSAEIGIKILTSFAIILVLYILRRILLSFARKTYREQPEIIYRWFKGTQYSFYAGGFLLFVLIWIPAVGNIGAFLGIMSAGFAIALKEPIINLAGWIFILLRRPFNVRDRIQIGELSGDVIDVRIFQTAMLEIGNWVAADQSTGRVLHIPNGKVFTEPIANYTQGLAMIWNEISTTVTYESDWKQAKEILLAIAEKYNDAEVQPQYLHHDRIKRCDPDYALSLSATR